MSRYIHIGFLSKLGKPKTCSQIVQCFRQAMVFWRQLWEETPESRHLLGLYFPSNAKVCGGEFVHISREYDYKSSWPLILPSRTHVLGFRWQSSWQIQMRLKVVISRVHIVFNIFGINPWTSLSNTCMATSCHIKDFGCIIGLDEVCCRFRWRVLHLSVVESDVSSACQAIASSTLHVGVVHSTCGTV